MTFDLPRYRASGRIHPVATLLAGLGGMAIAAALGRLYQYLMGLIPLVFLNVLIAAVAIGLIAAAANVMVWLGKVRNREVAVLIAVAMALSAVVSSHAWQYSHDVEELLNPPSVGRWLAIRADQGWSLASRRGLDFSIQGAFVYLLWMAEAALFVFFAAQKAWQESRQPYCEECQKWTDTAEENVPGVKRSAVESLLSRDALDGVIFLTSPRGADNSFWVTLIGHLCLGCRRTWLSIGEGKAEEGSDGKKKATTQKIVEHLVLEPHQQQRLGARLAMSLLKRQA